MRTSRTPAPDRSGLITIRDTVGGKRDCRLPLQAGSKIPDAALYYHAGVKLVDYEKNLANELRLRMVARVKDVAQ